MNFTDFQGLRDMIQDIQYAGDVSPASSHAADERLCDTSDYCSQQIQEVGIRKEYYRDNIIRTQCKI